MLSPQVSFSQAARMAKRRANLAAQFPPSNRLRGDACQTGRGSIKLELFIHAALAPATNQMGGRKRAAPRHVHLR